MTISMIKLQEEDIILDLEAGNKERVLKELTGALHRHCSHLDEEDLYTIVHERELIGSTGVGNGVAIPHGKVEKLDRILLSFGRSQGGVHFDSIDNQPVSLFVMILSPAGETRDYLQTLAEVSRLLKLPEKRRALRLATSREEIVHIFNSPVK